jgi:hypothetical protein
MASRRTPHPLRTRADSLPPHASRQLIIDLEQQGDDVTPGLIVDLRPELYGRNKHTHDKLRRSVSDRIRYLRALKRDDPAAYWYVHNIV